jgi:fimbrial chaperone protein
MARRATAWMLMLAAAVPAAAGNFSVAPVRIEMQGAQRTAVITVHNNDAAPLLIQASTLAWSQPGGEEQYEPTRELLATPPIFTLPPQGEQIVRVALRRDPDATRELDYRLLLAEVPQSADKEFTGLRVALHLSLPIFVKASTPASALLTWQGQWQADGTLAVSATNSGQAHLQVSDFNLSFAGTDETVHAAVTRYVLPGSTVQWQLKPPAGVSHSAAVVLHGFSDQGEFQADVAIAGP